MELNEKGLVPEAFRLLFYGHPISGSNVLVLNWFIISPHYFVCNEKYCCGVSKDVL